MKQAKQSKIKTIQSIITDLELFRSEQTDQTDIILIDAEINQLKLQLNQLVIKKANKQQKNRSIMLSKQQKNTIASY